MDMKLWSDTLKALDNRLIKDNQKKRKESEGE